MVRLRRGKSGRTPDPGRPVVGPKGICRRPYHRFGPPRFDTTERWYNPGPVTPAHTRLPTRVGTREPTPEPTPRPVGGAGADASCGLAALVLLCGAALPLSRGFLPPLVLLALALVLALRFQRDASSAALRAGGWAAVLTALPVWQKAAIGALTLLPLAVLCTVAARASASVLVAFPAAIWGLPALAVAALAAVRIGGRGRGPALVLLGLAVPVAGVVGARFEARGPEARGVAVSGPILGIHPFQSTAVIVDGYGPYDLPINDYVEPDGSRGYGPDAYADAIELALHEIAARHFPHGPARARQAFAQATASAETQPAVRQRLSQIEAEATQPRLVVASGTTGQRSRVQFVCPGKQDDPSGIPDEAVMNRMCPTKYISEASAGLGLTGRWAGYTEIHGNERLGLSRLLGWTRSDDAAGRTVVAREVRWNAWLALVVAAAIGIATVRRRSAAVDTAALSIFAVALVLAAIVWIGHDVSLEVAAFERIAGAREALVPRAWMPIFVVFGGALGWACTRPSSPRGPWVRLAAAVLGAGTLAVAGSVQADAWIRPDLGGDPLHLPLEVFVVSAADAIGEPLGLSVLDVEGALAAVVLAILVAAVISWCTAAGAAAGCLVPGSARGRLVGLVVPAIAAALVVSRKTSGAAALMPAAMAAIFVLGSGLSLLARRSASGLSAGSGSPRPARGAQALHVLGVALALGWSRASMLELPPSAFVVLCSAIGFLTLLGALALVPAAARRARAVPEGPPARPDPPP